MQKAQVDKEKAQEAEVGKEKAQEAEVGKEKAQEAREAPVDITLKKRLN